MTKEEIQDILEEFHLVRPEILQPKAKKLFEAIMIIADERDELQQRIDKAIEYINKNQLYNFDYDEEEIFEIVSDKIAKEYLLSILKSGDKNE